MARPRSEKYLGETPQERARERKAAHRARVRAEQGKPPVITPDEQRALDRKADNAVIATIRAALFRRGAVALADRLYPVREGVIHRLATESAPEISSPVQM